MSGESCSATTLSSEGVGKKGQSCCKGSVSFTISQTQLGAFCDITVAVFCSKNLTGFGGRTYFLNQLQCWASQSHCWNQCLAPGKRPALGVYVNRQSCPKWTPLWYLCSCKLSTKNKQFALSVSIAINRIFNIAGLSHTKLQSAPFNW